MKEAKFRIWDGEKMVYDVMVGKFGVFYVNPDNNGIDVEDSTRLTRYNTKYPDDIPPMEYTGLKDKNGVEIYEGDVFQYHNHPGYLYSDFTAEVRLLDASFGFTIITGESYRYFTPFSEVDELQIDILYHIEIVGNIYDKQHQKRALIDMMRGDEELGLYNEE